MTTQPEYILVPREPTSSALDRAVAFALNVSLSAEYGWSKYMRDVYLTMTADGIAVAHVHAHAPGSAVSGGGEQTRPSISGAVAPAIATLRDLVTCCRSWAPETRILGNVRADDAGNALESAIAALQQPSAQEAAWPEGLLDRVKAAEKRIEDGHAPRRIPADPTDVDLVLAEVRCMLEGEPPPFWVKPAAPTLRPVSDEDVETAAEALWNTSSHKLLEKAGHPTDWKSQPETIKRDYRKQGRAALESFLARRMGGGE